MPTELEKAEFFERGWMRALLESWADESRGYGHPESLRIGSRWTRALKGIAAAARADFVKAQPEIITHAHRRRP